MGSSTNRNMKINLNNFLLSIISKENISFEEVRKRLLFIPCTMLVIILFTQFGISRLINGFTTEGTIGLAMAMFLITALFILRKYTDGQIIYRATLIALGVIFIYIGFISNLYGTLLLWVYVYPPLTFYLLGKREGLIYSLMLCVASILFFQLPSSLTDSHVYTLEFKIRFIASFTAIILMTYIFELVRSNYQERLEKDRDTLEERTRILGKVNEAFRESQELFAAFADQIPGNVYIKDHEGRLQFLNQKMKKYFSDEDMIGKGPGDYLPAGLAESTLKEDQEALSKGKLVKEECNDTPEGKQYRELHKFKIQREGKSPLLGTVSFNITNRKTAEERIKRSEEQYRLLLESIHESVVLIDRQEHILVANAAFNAQTEISGETLIGKTVSEVFNNNREIPLIKAYSQVIETGKAATIIDSDGTEDWRTQWHEVRSYPAGENVLCIGRDITERKQAEFELIENEERYRSTFSNALDAMCIFDMETGKFIDINNAFLKMYGYSREEALQLTAKDINIDPESNKDDIEETSEKGHIFIPEKHYKKTNGSEFIINISARSFTWKRRKVMGAIMRDITEIKKYEEALHKSKETAEAASMAKSVFLANMSHELRTPLNAILGFSQLMERDSDLSEENKGNLTIISRSGEHLLELINAVLEMSKIEAGQISLVKTSFDLYRTLDDIESMMHLRSGKKGLKLIFERSDTVPRYIKTDERKIRQVLINLIGNAIKFTSEGKITLRVRGVTEEKATDSATIWFDVEDTGPGISTGESDKLFKAFTQTRQGRIDQEGTGLGLVISREHVQLMGGDITVFSQVGKGTTFTFHINAEIAREEEIGPIKPVRRVIGIKPDSRPPDSSRFRILVVEDNYESRILLCKLLEEVGFVVKAAENGKEAVDNVGKWLPHLIWMDLRMPVMDGYEAINEIRSGIDDDRYPIRPAIIVLTATAFEEEKFKTKLIGCDDFVRKPFRETEIFNKMSTHIGAQYIFADEEQEPPPGEKTESQIGLKAGIGTLELELRKDLKEALELSNIERINSVVEKIKRKDLSLGDSLSRIIVDFKYDIILNLINETK